MGEINMTQKIIILQGLPASGKSTWAREFITKNQGWKRINKDELRRMIDAGQWSKKNEKLILTIRERMLWTFLDEGYSVIIDDTNFEQKHIDSVRKMIDENAVELEIKVFNVDPKECIKRNALRPEHERVPENVIWDMYNRYIRPNEYQDQSPADQDPELPHIVICDLDGTLALMGDRNPYDCMKAGEDEINMPVNMVLDSYEAKHGDVIFFSGRSAECYDVTRRWLDDHGWRWFPLHMREEGDNRKDSVVKLEMYNKYVRGKYYVDFVLDDRDQVVDMWRKTLGLTCLQVNYGDF